MKIRSISKHLLVTQAVLLTVLVCLFSVGLYFYVRGVMYKKLEVQMAEDAQSLASMIEFEGWWEQDGVRRRRMDIETDEFHLPAYEDEGRRNGYFFINPEGEVIAQSPNADKQLIALADKRRGVQDGVRVLKTNFLPRKIAPGEPQWTLIVHRSTHEIDEVLSAIMLGSALCGGVLVVITVAACWWSVRSGVSPVNDLAHEVSEVDVADLSYRVQVAELPEELKPVGDKLNDLLDKIEKAFVRERRFSASAAHELRTPLAELKAILQVGNSMAQGDLQVMFKDGNEVVQRMESLLVTLLTLMGGRSEEIKLRKKPIDLGALLSKRIEECAVECEETQIALELEGADIHVMADEGLFSRVLDNLINNALSYGDKEPPVRVWIEQRDGVVSVLVSNHCSQLEVEDRVLLTEPFWRKDTARSGGEHLGLGLNLVQKYCEAAGWKLEFTGDYPELVVRVSGVEIAVSE